jgi:hypothetical protein
MIGVHHRRCADVKDAVAFFAFLQGLLGQLAFRDVAADGMDGDCCSIRPEDHAVGPHYPPQGAGGRDRAVLVANDRAAGDDAAQTSGHRLAVALGERIEQAGADHPLRGRIEERRVSGVDEQKLPVAPRDRAGSRFP